MPKQRRAWRRIWKYFTPTPIGARFLAQLLVAAPTHRLGNLLATFSLDITRCRKCGGRMRVREVVSDADAIARILHGAALHQRLLLPAN